MHTNKLRKCTRKRSKNIVGGGGRTCGWCSGKTTFLMENTDKVREDSAEGQEIWQIYGFAQS